MLNQWIECSMVQRVSLQGGLVLNLDDYNELVISSRLRLTLPPACAYPMKDVLIDPTSVAVHERPLLDLAGAVCTQAWCADACGLHLVFSRGHRIKVDADPHATVWELDGKRHGVPAAVAGSGWFATIFPTAKSSTPKLGPAPSD